MVAAARLKQKGLGEAVAVEEEPREVLLKMGAGLFASLLDLAELEIPGNELVFGEKRRNQQPRTFQTLFGPLNVKRTVFYRYETGTHRVPFDEALGIRQGCTPALLKLICRSAARGPYAEASADLAAFSAIHPNPKRMKHSGAFWSQSGAAQALDFRAVPKPIAPRPCAGVRKRSKPWFRRDQKV